jgi:hypothetical protein
LKFGFARDRATGKLDAYETEVTSSFDTCCPVGVSIGHSDGSIVIRTIF